MLLNLFRIVFILLVLSSSAYAQDLKTTIGDNKALDSLRKREDSAKDSVVFTARFIRYTTIKLSKDSIRTLQIDTSLNNFHNYSVLYQPKRPTIGLGNLGLAARPLLFENNQNVGFNTGYNTLEFYTLNHDDILFYRARTPYSSLYYVSGGETEQVFKAILSQNISRNWNVGFNYNRIGANGHYNRQRGDDLGASVFSWYQSPSKRYNLFASAVFNTLKAMENGGLKNDSIFDGNSIDIDRKAEVVNFNNANNLWRKNSISLRNTYFIGRIDSVVNQDGVTVIPTNKVSYNMTYTKQSYSFRKDEVDDYSVLPRGVADLGFNPAYLGFTKDTTSVQHLRNEFSYTFFLRPKQGSLFKNMMKIDLGIRNDLYDFQQNSFYKDGSNIFNKTASFQNTSFIGNAGYRFNTNVELDFGVEQIFQGKHSGDFLYKANSVVRVSPKLGALRLGAYLQNKSPEYIYESYYGNHRQWTLNFDKTKVLNLSAAYDNTDIGLDLATEYYLLSKQLYFGSNAARQITPQQAADDISILKFSIGKTFSIGKFSTEHMGVYQNISNKDVIRTPELYLYNSFAFNQTFFKVLRTQFGLDVRYNSRYFAQAYAPDVNQFYNLDKVELGRKPVVGAWIKASLKRANVFVKYDYVDQGLFNLGYYTTQSYPMPDRLLKFGVQWNFYD